jgi:predicted Zn-dependent protease
MMKHTYFNLFLAVSICVLTGCGLAPGTKAKSVSEEWADSRMDLFHSLIQSHRESGHLDKARDISRRALVLQPHHVAHRILAAKIAIESDQPGEALTTLAPLLNQLSVAATAIPEEPQPKQNVVQEEQAWEVYFLAGVAHEQMGNLDMAKSEFLEALGRKPNHVPVVLALAEITAAQGSAEEANSYLQMAGNPMSSRNPALAEMAGHLAMLQKDYTGAVRYFGHTCNLAPDNVYYLELYADALFQAKAYSHATRVLHRLVKLEHYTPSCWVYVMMGDCLDHQRRPAEALAAYRKAVAVDPGDAQAQLVLAKALMKKKSWAEAIQVASLSKLSDPHNPETIAVLAYSMIAYNQAPVAIQLLEPSCSEHPKDAILLCLLARAYQKTLQDEKAQAAAETALMLDPKCKTAKAILGE